MPNKIISFTDKNGVELNANLVAGKIVVRLYSIFEEFIIFIVSLFSLIPSHLIRKLVLSLIGVRIGKGSTIHSKVNLYTLGKIEIGKDTIIGEGTTLDARGKIKIGNHVDIASEVMIYTSEHDINSASFTPRTEKVIIEDYVFIGPRAIILPGVSIKRGAIVGAGAVVTKNVPELTVVAGIPANKIGERKLKNPNYILGRARLFR